MSELFILFCILVSLGLVFIKLRLLDARVKILEAGIKPVPQALRIKFYHLVNGQLEEIEMADIQIGKPRKLVAKAVDAAGNEAVLEAGSLQISATDPALLDIVSEADGSITVACKGPLGSLKLQASGDADPGEGVVAVFGELDVNCIAGDAVAIQLSLT